MVCLHLCNDFLGSNVYERLYLELDKQNIEQHIYHPFRNSNQGRERELNFSCSNSGIYFSKPLKIYHRIFFRSKINFLYKNINSKINFDLIQVIHATTLFSDGALALKLYQKYNIPYLVTVRMTDISVFLKYRPDLVLLGLKILKHASRIIFITPALKQKLFDHPAFRSSKPELEVKASVIQNGIHQYWIDNRNYPEDKTVPCKVLYVGTFKKRKNVPRLMMAILELRKQIQNLQLTIVGTGGADEDQIETLTAENPTVFNFIGPVQEKEKLRDIFRSHDIFAMPSYHETFGLVYIEALSQGLPILFSKNQGVDGIINFPVGESVNPDDTNSIAQGILKIARNYKSYKLEEIDFKAFSWEHISKEFIKIYESIKR